MYQLYLIPKDRAEKDRWFVLVRQHTPHVFEIVGSIWGPDAIRQDWFREKIPNKFPQTDCWLIPNSALLSWRQAFEETDNVQILQ
jgi:hypothetical protein